MAPKTTAAATTPTLTNEIVNVSQSVGPLLSFSLGVPDVALEDVRLSELLEVV